MKGLTNCPVQWMKISSNQDTFAFKFKMLETITKYYNRK